MHLNRTFLLLWVCLPLSLFSADVPITGETNRVADFSLPDGSTLWEPRVIKTEPGFVTFQHRAGIRRVPIKDLPEVWRAHFPYDPKEAEQIMLREAETEARLSQQRERRAAEERMEKSGIPARLKVLGVWEQQAICGLTYETMGTETYRQYQTVPLGEKNSFNEVQRPARKTVHDPAIYVIGLPVTAFQAGAWTGRIYPAGEISIPETNSDKIMKLKRYTLDPVLASSLLYPNLYAPVQIQMPESNKPASPGAPKDGSGPKVLINSR